jgi:hypothetical protein
MLKEGYLRCNSSDRSTNELLRGAKVESIAVSGYQRQGPVLVVVGESLQQQHLSSRG